MSVYGVRPLRCCDADMSANVLTTKDPQDRAKWSRLNQKASHGIGSR